MGIMKVARVEDLRTWQLFYRFKRAIYALIDSGCFHQHPALEHQLRESAASAVSQLEEGFARFNPKDNARFVVGAKSSLMECCGHLRDAVDRRCISESERTTHDALAREALHEVGGYIDYLQSPEAEENARRIKARREARRKERRNSEPRTQNSRTQNPEPRTPNPEPNPNPNQNKEPGTRNRERS